MSTAARVRQQRKGQVVVPTEPMFLTLTGLPANRSPFRIVRSDKVDELSNHPRMKVERADHIVSIQLPSVIKEDEVQGYIDIYGLDDKMFKQSVVDGSVTFTRRSDDGIDKTTLSVITMPKGEKVTIARSAAAAEASAEALTDDEIIAKDSPSAEEAAKAAKTIHSLVSYRFDCTQYTTAEAVAYVEDMGLTDMLVSYASTGSIILSKTERADTDPEINFRLVIDQGVLAEMVTTKATTTRSDDVTAVTIVTEEPNPSDLNYFGRWGWYASTMKNAVADLEYSQKVDKGIDLLYDVLRNIMMWQYEFSVAEVKTLMEESLDYAKTYFGQLLDALPAPTQRSDSTRGSTMALSKEDKIEMAQLVAETLAAENAKRSDAEAKEKEAAERKRADDDAAKLSKEQAEEIVRLRADVEKLLKGGVVIERSDATDATDPLIDGDTTVTTDDKTKETTKRSDTQVSVFAGIFGDVGENLEE